MEFRQIVDSLTKKKILLQTYCKVAARLLGRNLLSQNLEKKLQDFAASDNVLETFTKALPKLHNFLLPSCNFATGSPDKYQILIKRHSLAKRIIFSVSIVTIWY